MCWHLQCQFRNINYKKTKKTFLRSWDEVWSEDPKQSVYLVEFDVLLGWHVVHYFYSAIKSNTWRAWISAYLMLKPHLKLWSWTVRSSWRRCEESEEKHSTQPRGLSRSRTMNLALGRTDTNLKTRNIYRWVTCS